MRFRGGEVMVGFEFHGIDTIHLNSQKETRVSKMNAPPNDEEDQGEVFLEEDDIIHEINVDEEGSSLCIY